MRFLFDEYWHYACARKRPATVELERRAVALYLAHGGSVESWHRSLLELGHSRSTANLYLRHLRSVFSTCCQLGLCQGNPALGVPPFKLPRTSPAFLTRSEVSRLLRASEAHRNLPVVVSLCLYAGLRRGEAVHARWEWFDWDLRLLTVRCDEGFQTKSGAERVVPLHHELIERLQPLRRHSGLLVQSQRVSRRGYDARCALRRAREAAGVPRATFCLLRHTFGSWLAQQGVSIFKISRWMGHSSVKVTERYYVGLQAYDPDIDRLK